MVARTQHMYPSFYRQLFILTEDEFFQLFLRKRAVFGFILYTSFLILSFYVLQKMIPYGEEFLRSLFLEMGLPLSEIKSFQETWMGFNLSETLRMRYPQYAVIAYPWPLVLYYMVALSTLPYLIPFISCDMISKDVSFRTQRLLLPRMSRSSYYMGKTLAHGLLYLGLQVCVLLVFIGWVFVVHPEAARSFQVTWLLDIHCRLIPLFLCFLGFTQGLSALCSGVMQSLIVIHLALILEMVLWFIEPQLSLFNPPLWQALFQTWKSPGMSSLALFLLWGFLFWAGGLWVFSRRSLQ
jgi:hypothetical protein